MAKVLTRSATVAIQHSVYVIYSTASTQHNTTGEAVRKTSPARRRVYISFIFIIQFFNENGSPPLIGVWARGGRGVAAPPKIWAT